MYMVVITIIIMMMMEGVCLTLVEIIRESMLSTSFAMIFLGYMFLFAGFFIKVIDMSSPTKWIPWISPTKYILDGILIMTFQNQNFQSPFDVQSGSDVLNQLFDITSELNAYYYLAISAGWLLMFRFAHWMVLKLKYRRYLY